MGREQENDSERRQPGEEVREGPPPLWEWVVAGIGLVLVLASVGYLTWEAVQRPRTGPEPVIEGVRVEPQGAQYLVHFRVRNRGTLTAERLKVGARLLRQGQPVEEREAEFEFLPGGASVEGGMFFSQDPRQLQLQLDARSYQKP